MDHARPGEIDHSVAQPPVESDAGQPAAAPDPIRRSVSGSTTHSPYRQKFFHRQRSTIAPAGMRAALSIRAIMKKKKAKAPAWARALFDAGKEEPLGADQAIGVSAGCLAGVVQQGNDSQAAIENRAGQVQRGGPARGHGAPLEKFPQPTANP